MQYMLHGTINEQGNCLDVRYNISKINEYFSHVFLNWIERKKGKYGYETNTNKNNYNTKNVNLNNNSLSVFSI